MNRSKKVLLVGWDAADWKVIHKLMDEGKMPTVSRLVESGTMGNMATLFPPLSPMLWTSIATGKRPYKHGIYGFTEPSIDGKSVQPMTNLSRRCKAVWNILNQHDLRSIVVGWWPSHPAEPINGIMVSDFFGKAPKKPGDKWRMMKNCVFPPELQEELAQLRLHPSELQPKHVLPFIPRAAEIDQDKDPRLSMVMKMICECVSVHRASSYLLRTRSWDFAAVYLDAIDHFCHGFMKYHPPKQNHVDQYSYDLYHQVVTQAYIYHDLMLSQLLECIDDQTNVILMSDHGFHPDHLRPKSIPTEPAGPAVEHRNLGIFVASGPGIKKDHIVGGANLLDITPTILQIYGLPYGEDMDGQPLFEIFEDETRAGTISSWETVDGDDGQHPKDIQMDSSQSQEAMEQLIALGYVDRPDDDSSIAVEKCQCELDYNLARAYMDGGFYGEAIPLLVRLYNHYPLEFRFGLQLSDCLKAMGRRSDLESLVNDLNGRWRVASEKAQTKLRDFAKLYRERRLQFRELKKLDQKNIDEGNDAPKLAQFDVRGKPILFSSAENQAIKKIRSVAKGNPKLLDFLSATIAASKDDFDLALSLMEKAEASKSRNPMYHYQLGNFYLGLNRSHDAERAFEKTLSIDEFNPMALLGLCRVSLQQGKIQRAIDFGKQAIAVKYHFPIAHFYFAKAKLVADSPNSAVTSLETALAQNPNFPEALQQLISIYSKQIPDETLRLEHEKNLRELVQQQEKYQDAIEPIQLKPVDDHEFENILPKFGNDNSGEFIRCLAQPRQVGVLAIDQTETEALDEIIIVTGLPRSGTSMMMQMLTAGGLTSFTDNVRDADESNPKGYFESEKVKKLPYVNHWLGDCNGKVLKVVAPLISYLPQKFNYRVILMIRDIGEVVESQEKMLQRLQRSGGDLSSKEFE
ncbi:MAG: alkaline phosphatase family protein, partial [Planctomycetota bacterium]